MDRHDRAQYVVGVKREKRSEVPRDWVEIVRGTPGVTVLGECNPTRLQIEAEGESIDEIRRRLAEYVYIERTVPHSRC